MPPSTWLFNAVAPMAANYIRRRYRRKVGNAMYRRMRRSYSTRTAYLRGTGRARSSRAIVSRRAGLRGGKRSWSRAMGASSAPSARTKFKRSRFYTGLGLKPGFSVSKKYYFSSSSSNVQDKSLYIDRMIRADYDANEGLGNRRTGRLCDVRGVKMRHWFSLKNLVAASQVHDAPIQVRWAILNPKTNTGASTDINTTNFFMNDGEIDGNDDATDFPTTGRCFKYMNRKVNKRRYGILQEGTFLLSNDVSSDNSRLSPTARKLLSLYIPVSRQMKWGTNVASDVTPTTNLYFVWWYVQEGDKDTAKKFGTGDTPIDHTYESITYFKDSDRVI